MTFRECLWIGLIASVLAFWAQGGGVTPGPSPDPAPITETGLRVLVTYNVDQKASLPREQMALIDSVTFRKYLDDNCVKAGGVPEWRIVPAEQQFNADQPIWQKLMAVSRASDFWLIATDGRYVSSIPLPANEQEALAIIGKFVK